MEKGYEYKPDKEAKNQSSCGARSVKILNRWNLKSESSRFATCLQSIAIYLGYFNATVHVQYIYRRHVLALVPSFILHHAQRICMY